MLRFLIVIISAQLLFASAIVAQNIAQDAPDIKREKRFHDTYLRFNQKPTPEENWLNAQANSSSGSYEIQEGDTLWDISDTLFGDPSFWPKIWSLNTSDIFNPHEITPEVVLQFEAGSLNAPPALGFKEGEDSEEVPKEKLTVKEKEAEAKAAQQAKADAENAEAEEKKKEETVSDEILEKVEIPPPLSKSRRPANIPQSLPSWTTKQSLDEKILMDVVPKDRFFSNVPTILSAYISDGPTLGEGSVYQTEFGGYSATVHHYIYVKIAGASAGQRFLVVKDIGPVVDPLMPKDQVVNSGILTHVQGVIQIAELVNSGESVYRALVLENVSPIEKGAVLISGELPTYTLEEATSSVDAPARIIGGAYSGQRTVYGKDQILFLNAGTSGGLTPGQFLSVYKSQVVRDPQTVERESPRRIGVIKVVKVGTQFATAVVVSAQTEIRTGDMTFPAYK